jgi:hypothetical protein
MARPYISIGRGGPRVGVVLGRRDIGDIARIAFVGVGAVAILCGIVALGNASPAMGVLALIGAPLAFLVFAFWHAARTSPAGRSRHR